jgi:hypothetical protein
MILEIRIQVSNTLFDSANAAYDDGDRGPAQLLPLFESRCNCTLSHLITYLYTHDREKALRYSAQAQLHYRKPSTFQTTYEP